ncbi:unnamed protein product [Lepidochelys kempii]
MPGISLITPPPHTHTHTKPGGRVSHSLTERQSDLLPPKRREGLFKAWEASPQTARLGGAAHPLLCPAPPPPPGEQWQEPRKRAAGSGWSGAGSCSGRQRPADRAAPLLPSGSSSRSGGGGARFSPPAALSLGGAGARGQAECLIMQWLEDKRASE